MDIYLDIINYAYVYTWCGFCFDVLTSYICRASVSANVVHLYMKNTRTHIYIYMYIYICIHIYIYTHPHVYTYVFTWWAWLWQVCKILHSNWWMCFHRFKLVCRVTYFCIFPARAAAYINVWNVNVWPHMHWSHKEVALHLCFRTCS